MNEPIGRGPDPAYRNVLVPLDGSRRAAGALPTARALAERFGATVHTVTVTVSHAAPEVTRIRTEAAHALATDPDDERIHVAVDTDHDVAGAVQVVADELQPSLVCLATHARGRVGGTLIGAVGRDIVARGGVPVVAAGPLVVDPDPEDETATPPLAVDHIVACVDGTARSERVIPAAAAWAHAISMKLTIVTVAEPCSPPVRIGAPWRRHHGPNEDAEEYLRRLAERCLEAPGLDTFVVYDPISPAAGIQDYLAAHPTGLIAVTSRLRDGVEHLVSGSRAAAIVHASTAPALVVPAT